MNADNHGGQNKTPIRPNSNGYVPSPLDTGEVELSENIMLLRERLAANFHDVWGKKRIEEGWAYGSVRDDEKKTNPCLVYYSDLSEEEKEDDRISASEALKFIMAKGYTIEERKKPSMAEVYRMAWTDHGRSTEEMNFDATVFVGVFGTDGMTDKTNLTAALHSFYASLFELFGQKKALSSVRGSTMTGSGRYRKHAHTRFAVLSALETESELLAAKVAAGYGIETYKVSGSEEESGALIAPDGDAVGFICDHSLLSLAMWNGVPKEHPQYDSRMALAVRRALRGSTERLMELDMPDNITVFHMLTPIDGSDKGTPEHKLYGIRALHPYPLETGTHWYFRGGKSKAKKTDDYNRRRFERSVDRISRFNLKIKKRHDEVMRSPGVGDLMPGLHGNAAADRDLLRHLYTDRISFAAQKRRDRQTRLMMLAAVVGLGAYSILSDAPDVMFGLKTGALAPVLGAMIVLFLTVAMLIFFYQRRSGSHDEYVDFRLVSECLRVQTYWRVAGVKERVEQEFGAKSKLDFEWARYILRSWELQNIIQLPSGSEFSDDVVNEVAKRWYGREDEFSGDGYSHEKNDDVDQYGFTRNESQRNVKEARRGNVIRAVSVVAAYGLTVIVAVLAVVSGFVNGTFGLIDYLILLASLVQIIVAGYNLYASTKDYERLANNYIWLSLEYQKAIIACKYTADRQKQRELFRRTGCEAVREVCGWALEFSRNEPGSPVS